MESNGQGRNSQIIMLLTWNIFDAFHFQLYAIGEKHWIEFEISDNWISEK